MLQRYIGTRSFYARVFGVAVPILIQNGITNFVSMLDNIMVGQVGTAAMSGVSIANQLIFIFNLCIFGACAGAGIFTSQFHGKQDPEGIRYTLRFKVLIAILLTGVGIAIFVLAGRPLIGLYLQGEGSPEEAAQVLTHSMSYLRMMLWGLLPFALCNAYSGTLRETGQTVVPMVGGITAVCVNLVLNYVLIFGHFGAPAMGATGAALATVISRYVELAMVAGWLHLHPARNPFIQGVFRSFHIPAVLLRDIIRRGTPLLLNEFFWSCGLAVLSQCYSICSLEVVPALNIALVLGNLANVAYLSMGNAVGIIMGQLLGANTPEPEIRDTNRKLIAVSVTCGTVFGLAMAAFSGIFPQIYNTTESVRHLATQLICVGAAIMPFNSYVHSAYFTMRSGGKTVITLVFDSGFMWILCVPLAFCLSRFAGLPIIPLYIICQGTDLVKCALGYYFLKKGDWIQNITVS